MSNKEQETGLFSVCSGETATCEVMRLSIFLQSVEQDNQEAQDLRQRLANVACKDCLKCYLPDVQANSKKFRN